MVANLGRGRNINLQRFADINGFIPEGGDKLEDDFGFEEPNDFDDPEIWGEFVSEAVEATKAASQELDEWRAEA